MDLESYRFQFRKFYPIMPKVSLLGIRGYTNNERPNLLNDIYDDAIVSHVDGVVRVFTASVDPGSYYINHPLNPQGCAKLKCGLWSYALGEHHSHPALVQADEVTVERLDKTGKRLCEDTGYFAINVHSGGPEYLVGRYSAGCQVIKTSEAWKDQWEEFFLPIFANMQKYDQKHVPYLLVDKLEALPVPS